MLISVRRSGEDSEHTAQGDLVSNCRIPHSSRASRGRLSATRSEHNAGQSKIRIGTIVYNATCRRRSDSKRLLLDRENYRALDEREIVLPLNEDQTALGTKDIGFLYVCVKVDIDY